LGGVLSDEQPVSVVRAALTCRCPRCGKGKLFSGLLDLRASCAVCGLDFSRMDVGDGFVVPILMVLGFTVVGAAIWFDFTYTPPLWVHAIIWPPVTIVLAVVMTRYLKSFLAVQQYHVRKTEMGL
jgi:uncharacterized protein (DUF983 family)